ncbi:MAG: ATP-binding cassette domain-containing protein [Clostridia bacterium]|nr:ATP-binding cassette domain-containing protein [Clostridia bacterium]
MLSLNNLVKIYKTKGGVEVRALDGVSIDFPQTGMVFLLGRSGSGKSTLLNIIGGLDVPTSGEILVNGKSSKGFSSSDFDSYRNTFIGFVFQEYNLLNEFTVEQNIAIALQLQNKANDKEAVEKILQSVDLEGVGKRKPNTLSGGQRQRVAIARALIKEPEIIMADEPTGALDSNTGEQIFETLKKLSKNKLVIVVSHDRDFAEKYADRIIELSDGVVISDKSRNNETENSLENVRFLGGTITVKNWDKVSQTDFEKIIKTMRESGGETIITAGKKQTVEIKKTLGIDDGGSEFVKTAKVVKSEYVESDAKFIKSRLPLKYALTMSCAGLKVKPLRLIFTVLLSLIAFTLFGLTSTLMMYNPHYSIATAMHNSYYDSVVLEKRYDAVMQSVRTRADTSTEITREQNVELVGAYSKKDLENLNNNSHGLNFAGIIDFGQFDYTGLSTGNYLRRKLKFKYVSVKSEYSWYYDIEELSGFSDCGQEFLTANAFTPLTENSRYPENYGEIAISEYTFGRYKNSNRMQGTGGDYQTPEEIIGKTIYIDDFAFKVVGVYSVGEIPQKYSELYNENSDLDYYERSQLAKEFEDYIKYSFHNVAFVSADFYEHYKYKYVNIGKDVLYGAEIDGIKILGDVLREKTSRVFTERSTNLYRNAMRFYDLSGNQVDFSISEDEIILPVRQFIYEFGKDMLDKIESDASLKENYSEFIISYSKYAKKENYEDREYLYKTIISDYQQVTGRKLDMNTTYYIKSAYDQDCTELSVVGFYNVIAQNTAIEDEFFISDQTFEQFNLPFPTNGTNTKENTEATAYKSQYVADTINEKYGMIITLSQNNLDQTYYMLKGRPYGVNYALKNQVYQTSYDMADAFDQLDTAFLIAGIVCGLFASLMLFNFISVAIESKKNEIGVLRAVGARGIDVFKIFITQALIITTCCFILSTVASVILCSVINNFAIQSVIKISFLNFSFINVLIIFAISVVTAFLATTVPVIKAARRSPVESIRAV